MSPRKLRLAASIAVICVLMTSACATGRSEADVEQAVRDIFALMRNGPFTKEDLTRYCTEMITPESAAKVQWCDEPFDSNGFEKDTIIRIDDITINGDVATAHVDYRTWEGEIKDLTATFEWRDGKWLEISQFEAE